MKNVPDAISVHIPIHDDELMVAKCCAWCAGKLTQVQGHPVIAPAPRALAPNRKPLRFAAADEEHRSMFINQEPFAHPLSSFVSPFVQAKPSRLGEVHGADATMSAPLCLKQWLHSKSAIRIPCFVLGLTIDHIVYMFLGLKGHCILRFNAHEASTYGGPAASELSGIMLGCFV